MCSFTGVTVLIEAEKVNVFVRVRVREIEREREEAVRLVECLILYFSRSPCLHSLPTSLKKVRICAM